MTSRSRARPAAGHARRTRPIRRASARLSPVRAGAALAMLAAAAATYGVAASPAFGFADLRLTGLRYTDEAAVRARLDVPDDANLFALDTEPLEARLRELPTVAGAEVSVVLPATLAVSITEREPILVWRVGGVDHLVDRDGTLFALAPTRPTPDGPALPVVEDERAASAGLAVGARLDPVDLDAATRLGSLRPADVGSAATRLAIRLTDVNGFVVAAPSGWQAIFGFYTPSLRSPEMIPGQVRSLRSILLAQGERNVARVVLASETEGTFTTPQPATSPAASP